MEKTEKKRSVCVFVSHMCAPLWQGVMGTFACLCVAKIIQELLSKQDFKSGEPDTLNTAPKVRHQLKSIKLYLICN